MMARDAHAAAISGALLRAAVIAENVCRTTSFSPNWYISVVTHDVPSFQAVMARFLDAYPAPCCGYLWTQEELVDAFIAAAFWED